MENFSCYQCNQPKYSAAEMPKEREQLLAQIAQRKLNFWKPSKKYGIQKFSYIKECFIQIPITYKIIETYTAKLGGIIVR